MDKLKQIDEAIRKFNINKKDILPEILKKFEEDFAIRFSHESTKIEGNTLSIYEVKTLLVDRISVGGKSLREIYEVVNHHKAFDYVKAHLSPDDDLDENLIKDIHEILMENIFQGGIYRSGNVRITGASFAPPSWEKVRDEMKYFIYSYNEKKGKIHPVQLAAWVHAEFIRIHPFQDGNGRCARLLLNYVLMKNEFLPIIIEAKQRPIYYEALDQYGKEGSLEKFQELVEDYELSIIEEFQS